MGQRLVETTVAVTLLGVVLLNEPLIWVFDGAVFAGIPGSIAYIFGAWAVLIVLLAFSMRSRSDEPNDRGEEG